MATVLELLVEKEVLMMYRIVERYYKMGLFPLEKVKQSVTVKWITVDEYKKITGQDYEPLAE